LTDPPDRRRFLDLERMRPTLAEAVIIRDRLGIRKKREISEEVRARLERYSFRYKGRDQDAPQPADDSGG